MACGLVDTKPLSEPQCWYIVNWTLRNKLQWNFNRNSKIFIKKIHLNVSSVKCRPFHLGLNVSAAMTTQWQALLCRMELNMSAFCSIPKYWFDLYHDLQFIVSPVYIIHCSVQCNAFQSIIYGINLWWLGVIWDCDAIINIDNGCGKCEIPIGSAI